MVFFYHKSTLPRPLIHGLKLFEYDYEFGNKNRLWNRQFLSQRWQWHRWDKKLSLLNPHIFCVKVLGIVHDNLPKNVFSIDIPFKGSQRLSNMRSKVTTVHTCPAVTMTPLCMSQRCKWHRCATCSRVMQISSKKNSVLNYSQRYSKKSWLHMSQRCQ
jgi:hypothetical protein